MTDFCKSKFNDRKIKMLSLTRIQIANAIPFVALHVTRKTCRKKCWS